MEEVLQEYGDVAEVNAFGGHHYFLALLSSDMNVVILMKAGCNGNSLLDVLLPKPRESNQSTAVPAKAKVRGVTIQCKFRKQYVDIKVVSCSRAADRAIPATDVMKLVYLQVLEHNRSAALALMLFKLQMVNMGFTHIHGKA